MNEKDDLIVNRLFLLRGHRSMKTGNTSKKKT